MEEILQYTFAEDNKRLRQYQRLRKVIYKIDLGLSLGTLKDDFDDISHTLVVNSRKGCVGGVRLTAVESSGRQLLPMEGNGFYLQDIFPFLADINGNYGELSKLILLPAYRNGKITEIMYKHIYRKCRTLNIKYLFAITPKVQARRYVLSAKRMGFHIHIADCSIPTLTNDKYDGLAECLVVLEHVEKNSKRSLTRKRVVNY